MRLLTLADSGDRPVASMAGNDTSEPPPATALIAPVVTPAAARSAASAAFIERGSLPEHPSRGGHASRSRTREADLPGGGPLLPYAASLGAGRRARRLPRRRRPRLPPRRGRP